MKKILITGAGSYIGASVERWLNRFPEQYRVDTVDMIGDGWKSHSFRGYDAVLHVAGIVHREDSKHDPAQWELYHRVNTLLAEETARKAKEEGVKQFLFMSSASVYGLQAAVGSTVTIEKDTPLCPADHYGRSKKEAEERLLPMSCDSFRVAILRPPMIYGKGCRGNYQTLRKLALKLPVFPYVNNQRSMLYVDNLSEFIRLLIEDGACGIFCPQNREYVNTSEMVNLIAHCNGRSILLLHGLTWALKLTRPFTAMADKAFGSLCYAPGLSEYPKDYCVKNFAASVMETEA